MTQHVMILDTDKVEPYTAHVWRDDQVLMWTLKNPDLCWPDISLEPQPIQFLPADPSKGTVDWPGAAPAPIGDPPSGGEPDRRNYIAFCGHLMTNEQNMYAYKLMVATISTGEVRRVQVHHTDDVEGWYDPDVGNEPEP